MWSKIEPLLEKRGITPYHLSKLMGDKNDSNVYALKNGKIKRPSFDLILRIANALDVSLDTFR
ncbi:helix-turn-helix domain-containing protein [Levilactobacillus lindianensis]|uniref:helix-turn-helix domain-containing protein n=1 Tax=Levilactobacillus lindianensis TaxID=2486018 RepID=UPI000F747D26|nr:helix-turn-helix transcriptional regulator [Levilactobacillus lindianensis]